MKTIIALGLQRVQQRPFSCIGLTKTQTDTKLLKIYKKQALSEVSVSFSMSLWRKIEPNRHLRGAQKQSHRTPSWDSRNSNSTSLCRKMIANRHRQKAFKRHWNHVRFTVCQGTFLPSLCRKMIPNGHPKKLQKLYHTIICSHCCPRCPFIFLEPVQENGNRHLREPSKSFRKSSSKISHIEDKVASVCSIFPEPVQENNT